METTNETSESVGTSIPDEIIQAPMEPRAE